MKDSNDMSVRTKFIDSLSLGIRLGINKEIKIIVKKKNKRQTRYAFSYITSPKKYIRDVESFRFMTNEMFRIV